MTRLSAAEFAARRHLIGLTLDQLADVLHVNRRTVRSWEQGRMPIPERITDELNNLITQHDQLLERILDSDIPVYLPRRAGDAQGMPGGWYVAAAARAVAIQPLTELEWLTDADGA